jgi:hypothetical protein
MNTALEGSMEADKARMLKPGETKPAGTPSTVEFFPNEQPPVKAEPVSENKILPETTTEAAPEPPPLEK